MSDWWESRPGKMGGKPCYTGTRIPLATIRRCLQDRTPEQVQAMYPDLTVEQVQLSFTVEPCGCPIGEGHTCRVPWITEEEWNANGLPRYR